MANSIQDFKQILVALKDTIPPRSQTDNTAGDAIDVTAVGTDRISARLSWGAVVGFTSLDVKMQASYDGGSTWQDITDADGNTVAFTQVTAASGTPQVITFQLPRAVTTSSNPYKLVRAQPTLVGTSILLAVSLLANIKFEGQTAYRNAPPTIN